MGEFWEFVLAPVLIFESWQFGMEVVISGLLAGVMYSLVALGFVLIYKASGMFNFAQGVLVLFAALNLAGLIGIGVPIPLAILLTIGIMILFAVVVEYLILRHLVNQEQIILFMATIGLAFFLSAFGETIWGSDVKKLDVGIPQGRFEPFGIQIQYLELTAGAVAAALVTGLAIFFNKTKIGRALRAVADDHQAALSVGINLRTIWIIVWAVSGIVGVERVLATSAEGRSQVTLELKPFADAVDVLNATRTAVERIENFPPARADQPEIVRTEVIRSVLTFALTSAELDEDGLRGAGETLRADLLALPSVSFVSLAGTRDREIQIELSEEGADRVSILDEFILSPRTTLIFKPAPDQAFRVSYNQAFRSPSLRSSYADFGVGNGVRFDLRPFIRNLPGGARVPEALLPAPVGFFSPLHLAGNQELLAERLVAYEAGWAGALNDWIGASASVYVNERRDVIDATTTELWSTANPPPGWNQAFAGVQRFIGGLARRLPPGTLPRPVAAIAVNPAVLVDILGATTGLELPATLSWVNRESIRESGFEVGLNGRRGGVGGYVNYSWQSEPEAKGFDGEAISIPAAHRVNAGFDATSGPWTFGASLNYSDRSYWTDVLNERFHGWTEAFTMVNASLRVRLFDGRVQPSVQVLNVLNQEIQNHIFGDVLRRQVMGQIRYRF